MGFLIWFTSDPTVQMVLGAIILIVLAVTVGRVLLFMGFLILCLFPPFRRWFDDRQKRKGEELERGLDELRQAQDPERIMARRWRNPSDSA